jgi:hypothetical protein
MNYAMGSVGGRLSSPCTEEGEVTQFARAFDQSQFSLNDFSVSCVQFGYYMMSVTDVTIEIFVDRSGGAPDVASMDLVASKTVTTFNSYDHMQVQTTDFDNIPLNFGSDSETLVVVMTIPYMSEGAISGGGQINIGNAGTDQGTFVGGSCMTDYQEYSTWATQNGITAADEVAAQWYVHVSGTSTSTSSDEDDNDLSNGEVAFVATSAVVVIGLVAVVAYLLVTRPSKNSDDNLKENLI